MAGVTPTPIHDEPASRAATIASCMAGVTPTPIHDEPAARVATMASCRAGVIPTEIQDEPAADGANPPTTPPLISVGVLAAVPLTTVGRAPPATVFAVGVAWSRPRK